MSDYDYSPDRWVMLSIKSSELHSPTYKILAGWFGGFATGDSWKLNSGITKVEEDSDFYFFHGHSGSVYRCHKKEYGLCGITSSVLTNFQHQIKDIPNSSIEVVPEDFNFLGVTYE